MLEKVKDWKFLFEKRGNPQGKPLWVGLGATLLGVALGFYPFFLGVGQQSENLKEMPSWALSQVAAQVATKNPAQSAEMAQEILSRPYGQNPEAALWALEHLAWINLNQPQPDWVNARGYLFDLANLGRVKPGLWLELGKKAPQLSLPKEGPAKLVEELQQKQVELTGLIDQLNQGPEQYLILQQSAWDLAQEIEAGTGLLKTLIEKEAGPTA